MRNLNKKVGDISATKRHIMQRVTAFFLIPLFLWFIICVMYISKDSSIIIEYIRSIPKMVGFIFLISLSIYHGLIGIRVILEDYVKCAHLRSFVMILLYAICIVTIFTASILTIYMNFINSIG